MESKLQFCREEIFKNCKKKLSNTFLKSIVLAKFRFYKKKKKKPYIVLGGKISN